MCSRCLKGNSGGAHDQRLEMSQRCLLHLGLAYGHCFGFELQGFGGAVACVCGPFQEQVFQEHQAVAQKLEELVSFLVLKIGLGRQTNRELGLLMGQALPVVAECWPWLQKILKVIDRRGTAEVASVAAPAHLPPCPPVYRSLANSDLQLPRE